MQISSKFYLYRNLGMSLLMVLELSLDCGWKVIWNSYEETDGDALAVDP